MKDNVNVSERLVVRVRPFMVHALTRAEERLVEKAEVNAPGPGKAVESWDEIDPKRLISCSESKLWCILHEGYSIDAKKKQLADVINLCGMAYDTLEQQEAPHD